MDSPLLNAPGAVLGDAPDAGSPRTMGTPTRNRRALVAVAPGVVDRSHRGVVRITGPDRLSWACNSLSTQ